MGASHFALFTSYCLRWWSQREWDVWGYSTHADTKCVQNFSCKTYREGTRYEM